MSTPKPRVKESGTSLAGRFARIRSRSVELAGPLSPEDMTVQSMPDASPTKWHLAHVSWFFEHFVLRPNFPRYQPFDESFDHLFNSYYFSVGQMHQRPRRGLLSRPGVDEVMAYRRHVDEAMAQLIGSGAENPDVELRFLVTLGLHHEQQHQELILTDVKHMLAQNPLQPAYRERVDDEKPAASHPDELVWHAYPGGVHMIGAAPGVEFVYDNETPRHRVWLEEFEMADRPVSNGEYLAFIRDDGYRRSELWLSDGWSRVQQEQWQRPVYWDDSLRSEFTLSGTRPIDPAAPVCHLSYYEADAFARWAGARLPTEAEWELVAADRPVTGHFADDGALHPVPNPESGLRQLYGDVWEWTASPYAPYPGFQPLAGSLGEYNGKFMCSQMVLRGGSCATPAGHVRPTYRNVFYPHQRWQFSGLRLARSAQ